MGLSFKSIINNVTPAFTNAVSKAAKSAANNLIYGNVGDTGRVSGDDINNVNYSRDKAGSWRKSSFFRGVFALLQGKNEQKRAIF